VCLPAEPAEQPHQESETVAALAGVKTLSQAFGVLAKPLYVPMLALFFGWGLVTPILPLFAASFGASASTVGAVSGARAFGSLLSTLPAGASVAQHGVRKTTLYGASVYVAACVWGMVASGAMSLAASRVLAGAAYSLFSIGQQTFVRLTVPKQFRGRILATVGGTYRIGGLLAPLFGGTIAQSAGFRAVFLLQALVSAISLPFITLHMPDSRAATQAGATTLRPFLEANWRPVAASWTATALLSVARSVRDLLLPLAAAQAGLGRAATGDLIAASYAADALLFPLGGWLMDAHGCWLAGMLSCGTMGVGFSLLASAGASGAVGRLFTAGLVLGVGNGLSSGIVMALASAGAPESDVAGPYIASFQFVASLAGVFGPFAAGGLVQERGLKAACGVQVATAVMGAFWWALCLPRAHGGKRAARAEGEKEVQLETMGRKEAVEAAATRAGA